MNTKRYVLGSLAVFLTIFFFEYLLHTVILADAYTAFPQMQRSEADFNAHFHWIVMGELIMAFFFSLIFIKGREGKGIMEGARFGLLIGIGFGVGISLIQYGAYPWPGEIIAHWAVGIPVEMILSGLVIAAIYKPANA